MSYLSHLEASLIPSDAIVKNKKTPLMHGLCDPNLNLETLNSLIAANLTSLNQETFRGKTALDYAIKKHREFVETLLNAKANPLVGQTMIRATRMQSMEVVNFLFEKAREIKGDYGPFFLVRQRDPEKRTPLMVAIVQVQLLFVKLLLQHKADVNAVDFNANTPLIYTTRMIKHSNKHQALQLSEIVHLLLQAKADVHPCNEKGKNALSYVTQYSHETIYDELKNAGAILPSKVQFDYSKTDVIWIDKPSYYPEIASKIAKKLLEAVKSVNLAQKISYQPFREDVEDAIEMAQERLKNLQLIEIQGKDVVVLDKKKFIETIISCLSLLFKEKYSSIEEEWTLDQMHGLIIEEWRLFGAKKSPYGSTKEVISDQITEEDFSGPLTLTTEEWLVFGYVKMPHSLSSVAMGLIFQIKKIVFLIKSIHAYYTKHLEMCLFETKEDPIAAHKKMRERINQELKESCCIRTHLNSDYSFYDPASIMEVISHYYQNCVSDSSEHKSYLLLRHRMAGFMSTDIEYEKLQTQVDSLSEFLHKAFFPQRRLSTYMLRA